jgi:TolB-like protein
MPDKSSNLGQFWQELKRRKVVRVITVYAAATFVILELVSIIEEPLQLPDWTLELVIVLLCIGFIITVIFSWIYDITPEGIERTKPATKAEKEVPEKSSRVNAWKIATFISVIIIVGLIIFHAVGERKQAEDLRILDKSIAILPFINDSPDEENAYFINGIMEEILFNLQSIKELRVPGRTSVEQYRNNPKPIPEIASELNVAYIIEGSGQRYGNKIRLRVQLVEGAKDKHLWADSYDEEINEPKDVFRIQSQIAKSIASELQTVITPGEKEIIEKVPTTSLTAYDFYQRGREELIKYWLDYNNKEALERAEDLYRKAIEYDSAFALAYTGLADVYWEKNFGKAFSTEKFLDSILILTDIALSFDNQLSEAYVIRGNYYWVNNYNKEQIINEYDKAIKFKPNNWLAYHQKGRLYLEYDLIKTIDNFHKAASLHRGSLLPGIYGRLSKAYAHAGFKEKAIYYAKEALKLDDDSAAYYRSLADWEFGIDTHEKSIEFGEKSYAIDSTNWRVIYTLGLNHIWLGRYEEGLEYYIKLENILKTRGAKDYPELLYLFGYGYWVNGFKKEAEVYFNTAIELWDRLFELDRLMVGDDLFVYYQLAALYAFLGDEDKAYENLRLLNQLQMMPNWMIANIKDDPMLDSIRYEPEFQQIVRDLEAKYQAENERVRKWLEEQGML